MHRRRPVQFAEHHTAGALQVETRSRTQRNAAKICLARHEALHRAILHGGRFASCDERGRIRLQFLLINIHHLVMMGKKQHLFIRIQQRPHELRHIRRFGNARGLTLTAFDLHLPQRTLAGIGFNIVFELPERFVHRLHQAAVHCIIRIHRHHQTALGRQILQYVLLGAANHHPFLAQLLSQQLRLGYNLIAIAIAPFTGKALVITEEMIVQNVDHVPDLCAAIVDGRAAQADHTAGCLRHEAGGGVFLRTGMAQFLNLIEDHRRNLRLRQRFLPSAQKQIMHQVDICLRKLIGLEPLHDMYRQRRSVRLVHKAFNLILPVAHQMRRRNDQRGICAGFGKHGQRLHRLAKAHLIGQKSTVRAQEES